MGVGLEWVIGCNFVFEVLYVGFLVCIVYVVEGVEYDFWLRVIFIFCVDYGIVLMQVICGEFDCMIGGFNYQGVVLCLFEYEYVIVGDFIVVGIQIYCGGFVVVFDKVIDLCNLGVIICFVVVFGVQGVFILLRWLVLMMVVVWKILVGVVVCILVVMVMNFNQVFGKFVVVGWMIVGLVGEVDLDFVLVFGFDGFLVIVVGLEGDGLV